MKLKFTYIYIGLIACLVLGFMAFTPNKKMDTTLQDNRKVIKFSHTVHKDLTDCASCHQKAAESTSLKDRLMPNHDDCKSCHDVENQDDCNKCHINDNYEALKQNQSEMIFNHKFHLGNKEVNCETCHKGIGDVAYAEDAAQPMPKMEDCYSCHAESKTAITFCEGCHLNTAGLLPESHKVNDFTKTHKFAANNANANCAMCHNNGNNSCETCHTPDQLSKAGFGNVLVPNNFKDGSRMQGITRVHDINYRFNHAIDFQTKRLDCKSCHETETFCVNCHTNENKNGINGGIVPASHLKTNFFTVGVGTGGGLHADLARRDIESCQACHDVQGADATCIRCHLDNDGVKGTNPKTHPNNFMRDTHGDWHDSRGSVCYNCHTSTNKAGLGFCGYCHGDKHEK